ncbi:hypothetical protein [Lentzea sp. NPDC003310]|uniref:hypothetical protein n=1 Tax=Lentzea sp. NPDC003310 TaxID=3154447 RepID=UPI0033B2E361
MLFGSSWPSSESASVSARPGNAARAVSPARSVSGRTPRDAPAAANACVHSEYVPRNDFSAVAGDTTSRSSDQDGGTCVSPASRPSTSPYTPPERCSRCSSVRAWLGSVTPDTTQWYRPSGRRPARASSAVSGKSPDTSNRRSTWAFRSRAVRDSWSSAVW